MVRLLLPLLVIMSSPIEDFFRHPVITVSLESSDRIKELERQVDDLISERDRLFALYRNECDISMRAIDLLHAHDIKWR